MFEFMKTLTLHVSYECLKGGTLPAYLGSTIRGLMGHCIHEFYCHHRNVKCFCVKREGHASMFSALAIPVARQGQ